MEIVELRPRDLAQLRTLLAENHLPNDDCAEQLQNIRGIFDDAELIVAGGLEPVAPFALLRSVVVRRDYRAQGLAKRMTVHLLRLAQTQGVTSVYLLTETAEAYFEAIGFRRVEREEVPEAVQRTRQFDSLCPQTASCMRLDLPFTAVVSS